MEDVHGVELAAIVDGDRSAETSHSSSSQERQVSGPESSRMRRRSQPVRRSDRAVIHHSLSAQPTTSECPSGQPLAFSEDVEMSGTRHSNPRQSDGNLANDASSPQALNAVSAALSDLPSEGIDMSGIGSYRPQQLVNEESASQNHLARMSFDHPAASAPLATAVPKLATATTDMPASLSTQSAGVRTSGMRHSRKDAACSRSVMQANKPLATSGLSSPSRPVPFAAPIAGLATMTPPFEDIRMGGMRYSRQDTGSGPSSNASSAPAPPSALSPIGVASAPPALQTSQDIRMGGTSRPRQRHDEQDRASAPDPFRLLTEPLSSLSSASALIPTPSTAPPFTDPPNERLSTAPPTTTTFSQDVHMGGTRSSRHRTRRTIVIPTELVFQTQPTAQSRQATQSQSPPQNQTLPRPSPRALGNEAPEATQTGLPLGSLVASFGMRSPVTPRAMSFPLHASPMENLDLKAEQVEDKDDGVL
ncbi:hypothetical protein C1H76_0418 [Elsinoe australis]|uniref:Uncharacterized protein n=1 Tax=Elsinoe australis TaxID=40998 RepID=A0A4U7BF81_9PEZI|nr:hypothetical protein C1H76_0418 [Elsinoe australis]